MFGNDSKDKTPLTGSARAKIAGAVLAGAGVALVRGAAYPTVESNPAQSNAVASSEVSTTTAVSTTMPNPSVDIYTAISQSRGEKEPSVLDGSNPGSSKTTTTTITPQGS